MLVTAGSASSKQAGWRIVDLGTLGGKVAHSSSAVAINARGDVIGNSWSSSRERTRAFLWRGGALIPLGTLGGASSWASGINDRGQIVGSAETKSGKTHAFLWENGHMRDLGVLPGSDTSAALGITNSGLVAGQAYTDLADVPAHVVVWQGGRLHDLGRPWNPSRKAGAAVTAFNERGQIVGGTGYEYLNANGRVSIDRSFLWDGRNFRVLPPRNARTEAIGINEKGEIIGWMYRSEFRAAAWQRGQIHLLPLLPGGRGAFTSALNDKGEIVGYSWRNRDVDDHATLWRNARAIDLGTLGGRQSQAVAINNHGQIVGQSETATNDSDGSPIWDAFLWQNGQMIDLGSGYPVAINERGHTVGSSESYEGHAVVWLPN